MAAGRPSTYSEVKLMMAREYLSNEVWKTDGDVVPTVEGLALHLDVSRETIYDWARQEDKGEFSDTVAKLQALQGKTIVSKGLSGDFNSVIAKLILSAKHEYKEKSETDITTKGESLGVVVLPAKQ